MCVTHTHTHTHTHTLCASVSSSLERLPPFRQDVVGDNDLDGGTKGNFCYDCGTKYPVETAKFCCECGVRRMCM